MSRLYIQLGKAGDIISLLPVLYLESQAGEKPGLMVAAEYAGILEGCSYVDPVIFNGHPWELDRAVKEAKGMTSDVVCCQVLGPPEMVAEHSYGPKSLPHATTESFQKEAWKIAGKLNEWRNLPPLVFDKRSAVREAALIAKLPKTKKVMLVSLSGLSSPFPYRELLLELLRLKFKKTFEIVDLSTVNAERIYDLLGIYDKAHCLIADDSAPLHLAYACKRLPVVALVNDRPGLWNGSAWRPNHISHIRYRDFPRRAIGMLSDIEGIGLPGNWFRQKAQLPSIVHVWSEYEHSGDNQDRRLYAAKTWAKEYGKSGHWIASRIEVGAIGRDSQTAFKDTKRFPYVKDVIALACLRVYDDDLICLTRCDTAFSEGITEELKKNNPCFSYRRLIGPETHHPAVDMFCFTKAWWNSHSAEYPSAMVMGLDPYWHRILAELVKKHGGKEIKGLVSRAHSKRVKGAKQPAPQYITRNDRMAVDWLNSNSIAAPVKAVCEQLPCVHVNRRAIHSFGYNPSIIRFGSRILMAYRWHDEGNASTALAMAELDDRLNVTANKPIKVPGDKYGSHEDPRLFMFQGELHISYVCSTWPENPPKAVVRYGQLKEGASWEVINSIQPDIGKNDGSGIEKNWVMFESGGELVTLYNSGGRLAECEPLSWPWGVIRGGTTPLPYKGKLLSFFHSRLNNEPAPFLWRYAIGARLIDATAPFKTLAISKEPILRGSEVDDLTTTEKSTCSHHKCNVVFPAGAIEHDGGWLLSVGVNDCISDLVKITDKDLNL